jgi:hypothetical protein
MKTREGSIPGDVVARSQKFPHTFSAIAVKAKASESWATAKTLSTAGFIVNRVWDADRFRIGIKCSVRRAAKRYGKERRTAVEIVPAAM